MKQIKSIVSQVIADVAKEKAKQADEMRAWIKLVFVDEQGGAGTININANVIVAKAVPPHLAVAMIQPVDDEQEVWYQQVTTSSRILAGEESL